MDSVFHPTATRLWKHLPPEERKRAADALLREPSPELAGQAIAAMVKARRLRPQAARSLPRGAQARILATVLDPGETLAQGLLVSLHLGERRPLLRAFLDALGLPHENGVLADETDPGRALSAEEAGKARQALAGFPAAEVEVYLNTLWLQDPDRWKALAPEEAAG
jgi:hypothetical protein